MIVAATDTRSRTLHEMEMERRRFTRRDVAFIAGMCRVTVKYRLSRNYSGDYYMKAIAYDQHGNLVSSCDRRVLVDHLHGLYSGILYGRRTA